MCYYLISCYGLYNYNECWDTFVTGLFFQIILCCYIWVIFMCFVNACVLRVCCYTKTCMLHCFSCRLFYRTLHVTAVSVTVWFVIYLIIVCHILNYYSLYYNRTYTRILNFSFISYFHYKRRILIYWFRRKRSILLSVNEHSFLKSDRLLVLQ